MDLLTDDEATKLILRDIEAAEAQMQAQFEAAFAQAQADGLAVKEALALPQGF